MATEDVKTMQFKVTPEKLLEVLLDRDYQIAREKANGALEASVNELSRDADRFVYEVHTKEYAKGITGLDKSKTEQAMTTYEWDLTNKQASWRYKGPHPAKVWGSLHIEPSGDQSKLTAKFNVEIKIPLMGKKIEKMVVKEVKKGWDRFEKVILEFCDR